MRQNYILYAALQLLFFYFGLALICHSCDSWIQHKVCAMHPNLNNSNYNPDDTCELPDPAFCIELIIVKRSGGRPYYNRFCVEGQNYDCVWYANKTVLLADFKGQVIVPYCGECGTELCNNGTHLHRISPFLKGIEPEPYSPNDNYQTSSELNLLLLQQNLRENNNESNEPTNCTRNQLAGINLFILILFITYFK